MFKCFQVSPTNQTLISTRGAELKSQSLLASREQHGGGGRGKQFCGNKLCPVTSGQELFMLCHSPHTIPEQCLCHVSSPMGTRAPLSLSRMPYSTGKSPILCLGMRKLQPLFIYLLPHSFPDAQGSHFLQLDNGNNEAAVSTSWCGGGADGRNKG